MSRLTLRLPDSLHQELEVLAKREHVSLNQYLVYALTRQIAPAYTIVAASPEEVQQQREQFDALLRSLRRASPDEIRAAMDERELVEPEPELDPELAARLRLRINEAREPYQAAQADK